MAENAEIGSHLDVAGIKTNVHDVGSGSPVLLVHGSGPGVSAWANWRLVLPGLARQFRVIAPDIVGFGYTEVPSGYDFTLAQWRQHLIGLLDALRLDRVSIVGNSFGGALALSVAASAPQRVERLVLMGSAGVPFPITETLDRVWGYQPSLPAMRALLDLFVYDQGLVNDDLARLRYEASVRSGAQEAFSAMFPAPRQQAVDALVTSDDQLRGLSHDTLLVHGRDDRVIPLDCSLRLLHLIERSQLHVFGRCGHWVQIEQAAAFVRLVAGFLGGDEASGRSEGMARDES